MVHDLYFDADALKTQIGASVVTIPLSRKHKLPPEMELIFRNVSAMKILDTEKIGMYDINVIDIDIFQRNATIIGCIPIRVIIRSDRRLDIEVRPTGTPAEFGGDEAG